MGLYRTNTIILNAVQWDETEQALQQMKALAQPHPERLRYASRVVKNVLTHPNLQIVSTAGIMHVHHLDWVVAGDNNTLFVLPNGIFQILASPAN